MLLQRPHAAPCRRRATCYWSTRPFPRRLQAALGASPSKLALINAYLRVSLGSREQLDFDEPGGMDTTWHRIYTALRAGLTAEAQQARARHRGRRCLRVVNPDSRVSMFHVTQHVISRLSMTCNAGGQQSPGYGTSTSLPLALPHPSSWAACGAQHQPQQTPWACLRLLTGNTPPLLIPPGGGNFPHTGRLSVHGLHLPRRAQGVGGGRAPPPHGACRQPYQGSGAGGSMRRRHRSSRERAGGAVRITVPSLPSYAQHASTCPQSQNPLQGATGSSITSEAERLLRDRGLRARGGSSFGHRLACYALLSGHAPAADVLGQVGLLGCGTAWLPGEQPDRHIESPNTGAHSARGWVQPPRGLVLANRAMHGIECEEFPSSFLLLSIFTASFHRRSPRRCCRPSRTSCGCAWVWSWWEGPARAWGQVGGEDVLPGGTP